MLWSVQFPSLEHPLSLSGVWCISSHQNCFVFNFLGYKVSSEIQSSDDYHFLSHECCPRIHGFLIVSDFGIIALGPQMNYFCYLGISWCFHCLLVFQGRL